MPFGLRRPRSEPVPTMVEAAPRALEARAVRPIELIVGLGNPGSAYAHNRHNVGYWTINRLARELGIDVERHTKVASTGEGEIDGQRLVLAKPRTFMNNSGDAVRELLRRYKLAPEQMLLIYDDLDLPLGRVRVRDTGGAGGQKGMKSIIAAAGTQQFPRIRIGIDRPVVGDQPSWDPEVVSDWVLGNPPPDQRRLLEEASGRAAEAALCCLRDGVPTAMNTFNRL